MAPSRLLLAVSGCLLACVSAARGDEPGKSVKELQKEHVAALTERLALAQRAAKLGAGVKDEVNYWEYRLAVAKLEMDGKVEELRKLLERRVAAFRSAEESAEKAVKLGVGSVAEVLEYRAARLEVEIALARLKKQ
jgi:hypothetical protein